jgi:hypothetical protein
MHGHALEGNERGWMTGNRNKNEERGGVIGIGGENGIANGAFNMKSEKNERALRALFVEFSFEVFALALDAMKKKARGNLLLSFLPLTCLYYAGGPSGRTDSLLVAVRSWKSCTLRSR